MITTFETLPNEILLIIFSELSWLELLTSLSSLSKRFDDLICSILSRIDNQFNSGVVIIEPGLSFNKCHSILLPVITHSSLSLTTCVRRIHFDGTNSNACDLIGEWLYDDEQKILRFPNVKSLILTRCSLMEPLSRSLPFLIKHQLDDLTLTFDRKMIQLFRNSNSNELLSINFRTRKLMFLYQELIRQFFTSECGLSSLRLDIACDDDHLDLHHCLKPRDDISVYSIFEQHQPYCRTLRRLHIHLEYTFFLEHLIEHVPALEELHVYFRHSLGVSRRSKIEVETLIQSNANWFNKVPKLRYFILNTIVANELELAYLKWILNNLNHLQKLELRLKNYYVSQTKNTLYTFVFDANFIRQYCLPDEVINLTHFDFSISSKCKLTMIDTEQIIHSFQIHPFFVDHRWTNVKYFYDPINSYQYLSSSVIYTPRFSDKLVNYPNIFYRSNIRYVSIDVHPSLYRFLEQFNDLFPNVFCIKIDTEVDRYSSNSDVLTSLEMEKCKLMDIKLRHVTRLDLGHYIGRACSRDHLMDRIKARANILALLISMPIQLKDLRISHLEWLLDIVQYASDKLRKNALNTVRYAEFYIPSCHCGPNESIRIGKNLVPFLSSYMPNLQTLRLWRPDDFSWTSIRPDFNPGLFGLLATRWHQFLQTPESINQLVNIFEQDLCQLIKQLKEFIFLDIHSESDQEKVESYHSMVRARFPNSRSIVETSRFRLWL